MQHSHLCPNISQSENMCKTHTSTNVRSRARSKILAIVRSRIDARAMVATLEDIRPAGDVHVSAPRLGVLHIDGRADLWRAVLQSGTVLRRTDGLEMLADLCMAIQTLAGRFVMIQLAGGTESGLHAARVRVGQAAI